jgi:three-Cys-motif partner protein
MTMTEKWGGEWTERKLEIFEDYVAAYLTIMYGTRKRYNGWPYTLCYIDGFAGSGTREYAKSENDQISKQDAQVYVGSAERVVFLEKKKGKKFDECLFIDTNKNALEALKKRIEEKNPATKNCTFINKNVNDFLTQLKYDKRCGYLVLLDPFGMEVKWETIRNFKNNAETKKHIDLWLLLPSGVIINRLLDREGKLTNIDKLVDFFGIPKNEIEKTFYKEDGQYSLFGESPRMLKIQNSISEIANIYINQLKTIFRHVTEQPYQLKNSKNVTIYHFIFASNNKTAVKIAGQIIEKRVI